MTETPNTSNCKICGKPTTLVNGFYAHDGGGVVMQKCKSPTCGWSGGQEGRFSTCPACGDATQLTDDHIAS